MKCEQCAGSGRDVAMESLGGGQFQCPDCRSYVVPTPTVSATVVPEPEPDPPPQKTLVLPDLTLLPADVVDDDA